MRHAARFEQYLGLSAFLCLRIICIYANMCVYAYIYTNMGLFAGSQGFVPVFGWEDVER